MKEVDEFITKLRAIKESRTLEEMSEETGVTVTTLSRILNRQRVPGGRIMVQLLIAYPKLAEVFWPDRRVIRTSR